MDTGKPTRTLADFLVIAINPALLIVLVHSLCFFLVEVFYRGEAAGSVRWVLFWFVLAVVLIARIGIEQGAGYAMGYGLALAFATWTYLAFVQTNVIFGALLLAFLWFTAHKLTCNCTLIDEDADASGQGLLQSSPSGRFGRLRLSSRKKTAEAQPSTAITAKDKRVKPPAAEIPGLWLIYYSLAALPLFGFGQMLLPAGDMAARHRGFAYLFFYLAAALGLLITTSFLGLRRYLRQRYLVMPAYIAAGWMQIGVVTAALVLVLALLLPRPGAGEAWNVLRYHVDYQMRRASEYAARFNPHGSGSGRPGDQTQQNNPSPAQPGSVGQAPNADQGQNSGPDGHGESQPGNSNQGAASDKNGGADANKPLPNLSPPAASLYPWLKTLFYLAGFLVAGWLCYRYRMVVLTMLRNFWASLRNLIAMLLALFHSEATPAVAAVKKPQLVPFRSFKNPFLTGGDRVWSPEQLIVYSYDALQSWALENNKGSPQTPREFCRRLAEEMPDAAAALEHLSFLYGHVAYGGSVPGNYDKEQLRPLWDYLSMPRPKRTEAEAAQSPST